MNLNACEEFLLRYVKARSPAELGRHLGASDIVQSVLFVVSRRQQVFRGTDRRGISPPGCAESLKTRLLTASVGIERARPTPGAILSREVIGARGRIPMTPSGCVSLQEEARQLIYAIGQLPDDIRRVVNLRYAESWTFEQIADELQMPISTCRRRWFEGCERLRTQLQALV